MNAILTGNVTIYIPIHLEMPYDRETGSKITTVELQYKSEIPDQNEVIMTKTPLT